MMQKNPRILREWDEGFRNEIPVTNDEISPCNFSINPLKSYRIFKKNKLKTPAGKNCAFHHMKNQ